MSTVEEKIEKLSEELQKLKEEVRKARVLEGREALEIKGEMEPEFLELLMKAARSAMKEPEGGLIFVGGIERKGGKTTDTFLSATTLKEVLEVKPERIVKVMNSFSNENRIKILQVLLKGSKTTSELSQETSLEGGQLYHHLKELMLAGYVETPERGKYALTSNGCMAIRSVAAIASIPGIVAPSVEEVEEQLKS